MKMTLKMQATSKFTRKIISQIITVYQWMLNVELPEIWIELLIKPNKDVDDMLDAINNELIKVCWEYLEDKKLWLDKYQLATVCAELTTLAMERCEEPFWVNVKTSKTLVKDYLEKNKQKRETLERIKSENDTLDKEIAIRKKEQKEKKVDLVAKPEMPSENLEAEALGRVSGVAKKKKNKWTDSLAIDNFFIPWVK